MALHGARAFSNHETGESGMTRKGWYFLGWGFIATLLVTACSVNAKPDKDSSLKDIMSRLHKGDNAIRPMIDKELQEDSPDWPAIQKLTKDYLEGVKAAAQKDPPKGDKESWKKLTKQYVAAAQELDDAAKLKDKDKSQQAHKKIVMGCADCHTVHRPKEK
jgi:hypothetical protein